MVIEISLFRVKGCRFSFEDSVTDNNSAERIPSMSPQASQSRVRVVQFNSVSSETGRIFFRLPPSRAAQIVEILSPSFKISAISLPKYTSIK